MSENIFDQITFLSIRNKETFHRFTIFIQTCYFLSCAIWSRGCYFGWTIDEPFRTERISCFVSALTQAGTFMYHKHFPHLLLVHTIAIVRAVDSGILLLDDEVEIRRWVHFSIDYGAQQPWLWKSLVLFNKQVSFYYSNLPWLVSASFLQARILNEQNYSTEK